MQQRTIVVSVSATLALLVVLAARGTWVVGGLTTWIGGPVDQDAEVRVDEQPVTEREDPARTDRDVEAARPAEGARDRDAAGPVPDEVPPPARPPGVPDDAEAAIVDWVLDGDTLPVLAVPGGSIPEGGSIRIRLLNIDTPELARSGDPAECGAQAATERVQELVASGDLVWLVADREDRDRFDRPLRGVWLADGTFLNELLAVEGYAEAVLVPPNDRFHGRIEAAVGRARAAGRGIWGEICPG